MRSRFKPDPLIILSIFFGTIAIFFGAMILIQVTQKRVLYISDNNIIKEDKKQILEVLNKSFEAIRNKDTAEFLDCYTIDSPVLKEIGGREAIIKSMMGIKKTVTYLQNIEVKFRKDIESFDSETMFGDASISLRETAESLWWYGFIEKQIHPHRVYSFRRKNGGWKIFLITDHSTGEEFINNPEIIMESAFKKLSLFEVYYIQSIYPSVRGKDYLDSKDKEDTRLRLESVLDNLICDFRNVTKLDPFSTEGYYYLGSMLALKGEFREAIGNLKKAIEISQDDTKINYKLGNRYYRAMLHCSLGQVYLRQNKIEDALNEFTIAIHQNPEYSQAYVLISRIYQMRGDIEIARIHRLEAFKYSPFFRMEPIYPNSRNKCAQELFSLAMLNPSPEGSLEQVIELDEQFISAYYHLGLTYSKRGERKRAIDCMNKVIELDPGQEDPYWELGTIHGMIYLHQREKAALDLSIQNFKKALKLNPYVQELYGSLGVNYFFKGKFNKAIKIMEKAKALCPYDPDVNFYMAMFLKKKFDSNVFISKKKRTQMYSKEIVPLLQLALDFCTDNSFREQIELLYSFVDEINTMGVKP